MAPAASAPLGCSRRPVAAVARLRGRCHRAPARQPPPPPLHGPLLLHAHQAEVPVLLLLLLLPLLRLQPLGAAQAGVATALHHPCARKRAWVAAPMLLCQVPPAKPRPHTAAAAAAPPGQRMCRGRARGAGAGLWGRRELWWREAAGRMGWGAVGRGGLRMLGKLLLLLLLQLQARAAAPRPSR